MRRVCAPLAFLMIGAYAADLITTAGGSMPEATEKTTPAALAEPVAVVHDADPAERVWQRVQTVRTARLTPLVRRALGCETLEVAEWRHERMTYLDTNPISLGLYRITGTARDHAAPGMPPVPWSLIVKVARSPSGITLPSGRSYPAGYAADPSHDQYWRREIDAYQSPLLGGLPPGLAAPHCYAIDEDSDGYVWLWLENVTDEFAARGEKWPLSRYGLAARHLGRFNGAYLAEPDPVALDDAATAIQPLLGEAWLSRRWLQQWVARRRFTEEQRAVLAAPDTWSRPLVRRFAPQPLGDRLLSTEDQIPSLLGALDSVPSAVSHLDAYSRNLLARRTFAGDEETVAIDWAFVGIAPLGVEPATLVTASVLFGDVPGEDVQALDQQVFEGYLDGLREAGWSGDWRLVRLGHAVCAALRFRFTIPLTLGSALDESTHAAREQRTGRPVGDWLEDREHLVRYMLGCSDEAAKLARALESRTS